MGGAALRGKKREPAHDPNHEAWRMPKQRSAASAAPARDGKAGRPPDPGSFPPIPGNRGIDPAVLRGPAARVAPGPSIDKIGGAGSQAPTRPPSSFLDDDDDDDLAQFANLAQAADQVWNDLMEQQHVSQEVGSLIIVAEMKDAVARAAKRSECLQRECQDLRERSAAKLERLEELCNQVENTSPPGSLNSFWKLGDLVVRRGKGLCEVSTIHNDSIPPYFEVRMLVSGDIVGTEAGKLVQLSSAQQGQLRAALREYEKANASVTAAEEAAAQASRELQQQHQSLSERVERKLQAPASNAAAAAARPVAAGPGPPIPGGRSATPPGMPSNMSHLKRWGNSPGSSGVAGGSTGSAQAVYPEAHVAREDVRVHGGFTGTATAAPPDTGSDPARAPAQPPEEPAPRPATQPAPRPAAEPSWRMDNSGASGTSAPPGLPSMEAFPVRRAGEGGGRVPAPAGLPPLGKRYPPGGRRISHEARRQAGQQAEQQQRQSHSQQQRQQQGQQQPYEPQQQQPADDTWVVYSTLEGQLYYHNERTNETSWSLPPGAQCRQPGGAPPPKSAADAWAEQLRQQEAEMQSQRDNWAQWYSQYCSWYQSQQQQHAYGQQHGYAGGAGGAHQQGRQQQQEPAAAIPKGPAPPTIDASREDQAIFAIKSSLLKEMESMVQQGAPVAQRKKALRCLQIKWHPDKNPDKSEAAKCVFQFIEETKSWFLHDPSAEAAG